MKILFYRRAFFFLVCAATGSVVFARQKDGAFLLHGGCITSGDQTIQNNTTPGTVTATPATGGSCEVYSYQWQVSVDNVHFYDVAGATTQNLNYTAPVTSTLYFQRKTVCGEEAAFTNAVRVLIGEPCSTNNCSGNDRKCIGGQCEIGTWVVTSSVRRKVFYNGVLQFMWVCTHHYCFSDGTFSSYYEDDYHDASCPVPFCGSAL